MDRRLFYCEIRKEWGILSVPKLRTVLFACSIECLHAIALITLRLNQERTIPFTLISLNCVAAFVRGVSVVGAKCMGRSMVQGNKMN